MNIKVIIDCSGSMGEMGKSGAVTNCIRFFLNLDILFGQEFSDTEFDFFLWNETLSPVSIVKLTENGSMVFSGTSDVAVLNNFMTGNNGKFLLISDGNCDGLINGGVKELVCVAVGKDAQETLLADISKNNKIFGCEEILSAVLYLKNSN